MNRYILVLISALALAATGLFFTPRLNADEGEWLPEQLQHLDWPALHQRGLELDADEIWDGEQGLLSAAVQINGCSASFVSDLGLVVTNHHCGFGAINRASTIEHNYLEDGFIAADFGAEIPSPGMIVSFVTGYEDVTGEMHAAAEAAGEDPVARLQAVNARRAELAREGARDEYTSAVVVPYFEGRIWRRIFRTVLRDVRLVYAPPRDVGEYGGETDNWMWPRHTGDFSFFRAYVSADGKPAEYAADNVPYHPGRHLQVSEEGADDGDLVMILGYPGSTSRYLTSLAVQSRQEMFYPARQRLFVGMIADLEVAAAASAEAELRLASRIKSLSNVEKNARGMVYGLARNQVVANKEAEETDFQAWVDGDPTRQRRYGDVLQRLMELDRTEAERMEKDFVLDGLQRYALASASAMALMREMGGQLRDTQELPVMTQWLEDGAQDFGALMEALAPEYEVQRSFRQRQRGLRMDVGALWIQAQELWRGKRFYPDANSTLRVSIATVKGYQPRDGVWHVPHTTVGGMLAKHTGAGEFDAPDPIHAAVTADPAALDIPVCFLADGDTTGGNSGSPVVDGQGRLVGLNFDRVFENVSGDFGWNAERSRNISVDIRYVLWLMREVWPAPRLLSEMGLENRRGAQKASVTFRIGLRPDDPGYEVAEAVTFEGQELRLGQTREYSIADASVGTGLVGSTVEFSLDDADGFETYTGRWAGRPLAISLDGEILTVATLLTAIPGQVALSGGSEGFTLGQAQSMVERLTGAEALGRMEFRVVVEAADPAYASAAEFTWNGERLRFGPPRFFRIKRAYPTSDQVGGPALGFEVEDEAAFQEWTATLVRQRLGVFFDGRPVTVPMVMAPLPGEGVLAGGGDGFTADEVFAMIRRLRGD